MKRINKPISESSGQLLIYADVHNYPEKSISAWVQHIINAAETYPDEKLVASWNIFQVETLLGKTVKVFIEWQTEKSYNDTLGNNMFVVINDILEYDLDKIPDFVLDKINEAKKERDK